MTPSFLLFHDHSLCPLRRKASSTPSGVVSREYVMSPAPSSRVASMRMGKEASWPCTTSR